MDSTKKRFFLVFHGGLVLYLILHQIGIPFFQYLFESRNAHFELPLASLLHLILFLQIKAGFESFFKGPKVKSFFALGLGILGYDIGTLIFNEGYSRGFYFTTALVCSAQLFFWVMTYHFFLKNFLSTRLYKKSFLAFGMMFLTFIVTAMILNPKQKDTNEDIGRLEKNTKTSIESISHDEIMKCNESIITKESFSCPARYISGEHIEIYNNHLVDRHLRFSEWENNKFVLKKVYPIAKDGKIKISDYAFSAKSIFEVSIYPHKVKQYYLSKNYSDKLQLLNIGHNKVEIIYDR